MKHKCQDKKQLPGTNCQRHQPYVQDNSQTTNPEQTPDKTYLTHVLSVRTPDEASLFMTSWHNSHAGKPWTLVSAPSAIIARTFENLSLHHNPLWLILLAWIPSTGQRLSHDHRSHDLHSSCLNIASIMTGTKGISAHQATDLPAILLWLVTLLFFFAWRCLC